MFPWKELERKTVFQVGGTKKKKAGGEKGGSWSFAKGDRSPPREGKDLGKKVTQEKKKEFEGKRGFGKVKEGLSWENWGSWG